MSYRACCCDWVYCGLQGWQDLIRLQEIAGGSGAAPLAAMPAEIEHNEQAWRAYYDSEAPESAHMPNGYSEKLNAFEQLLVSSLPFSQLMVASCNALAIS